MAFVLGRGEQPANGCRTFCWALLLYTILLLCVNGQYSPYNEHAKYPSLFRSSAARQQQTTAEKGVDASAEVKTDDGKGGESGPSKWTSTEGDFNVNLDIGLVDVEPEANLFLDETPLVSFSSSSQQDTTLDGSSVRETRHLALVHSASSVAVRATYGPFTARQTINPFSAPKNATSSTTTTSTSSSTTATTSSSWSSAKELKKVPSVSGTLRNAPEQITAYLVTKEVRRSHPVLRVLFYASHLAEYRSHAQSTSTEEDKTLCAAVIVQYHGERLFGTCSPSTNKQNACLAEVTIPALYWPPLDVSNGGLYAAKQQKSSSAKVYYTIAHTAQSQQCNDQNFLSLLASSTADGDETVSDLATAEMAMNLIYLSDVSLVPFRGSYEEVTNDNVVTVLIPQEPVYPNSKIYIPVKYTYNPDYPVSAFSLRVQVKPGLKILGAQLSHPNKLWQLSVELGAKQTTATVTAFLRDFEQNSQQDSQSLPDELLENMSQEVYSWLIEVEENIDISEVNGRIVWQLLYNTDTVESIGKQTDMQQQQSQQQQENEDFEKESVKLTSLIDIQKDVVMEILAITKSRELLNTAILNGRQVSRTMRIYQVSAAGSISDITFQCSCQSADESIIKVSPSCTSVYLDGSEVRGSQNASILIKYGSFTGLGNFIVWMPLIPLDVRVGDSKLSQIKGWRVPFLPKRLNPFAEFNENTESRFDFLDQQMLMDESISETNKYWTASASASASAAASSSSNPFVNACRLRFQQTRVEVYTRFLSTDHNSGREASLLNRRHSLRITHLVRNLIRVTDSKVLRIRGNQVEGVGVGRADVEIISPLTGSVIGSKEVRVSIDRESITHLEVRPVSGLKLQVEPFESNTHNVWTTTVHLNSKLTKQYQEALLDARIYFTDKTWISLSELSPTDYDLSVDTFKGVVAYVSRVSSAHQGHIPSSPHLYGAHHELPRIIALLPGEGELVHVTLDLPYACQRKKSQSLVSAYVDIDVRFQISDSSSLQNDAINYRRLGSRQHTLNDTVSKSKDSFRLMGPLGGGSLKKRPNLMSSRRNYPLHQAAEERERITYQRHSGTSPTLARSSSHFEFGLYGLLTVVSVASIIVVLLYSVFSLRFRHKDTHVTTTATSDGMALHNFSSHFLSCVSSGHHHENRGGEVTNAKEWVWVGGNHFQVASERTRCGRAKQVANEDECEEMIQVRRPLLPSHHCGHNGNLTESNVKIEEEQKQQQTEHRNTRGAISTHSRQSGSSGAGAAFRITANPSEMLPDSEQFNYPPSSGVVEHACLMPVTERQCTATTESASTLQSVLIPMNHKSTRINATSGLSFLSPDEPPPPIPLRTRHLPSVSEKSRRTIGSQIKGPPIWRHHQKQHQNWQLTGEREQQCELEHITRAIAPPIPPHRMQEGSKRSSSGSETTSEAISDHQSISSDLSTGSGTHPPPVPPHRGKSSEASSSRRTLSSGSASSSSANERSPQPVRPKHLRLAKRHAPQNRAQRVGSEETNQQQPNYRTMMKVLERLKESNA